MNEHATRFLLIRHGETDWNRERRLQGHTDVRLNATGERQARKIAAALASTSVDAIWTSDLLRARDTAAPIAQTSAREVVATPSLRERHYGAFEGLRLDDLPVRYPLEYKAWVERNPQGPSPQGAETLDAFHRRAVEALDAIARAHPGQCIVVVTHGGVLDSVYRYATGRSIDVERTWDIKNASINSVDWRPNQPARIVEWGATAHLDAALDELTFASAAPSRLT